MNKREREELLRQIKELEEFAVFTRAVNASELAKILRAIVRGLPHDKGKAPVIE